MVNHASHEVKPTCSKKTLKNPQISKLPVATLEIGCSISDAILLLMRPNTPVIRKKVRSVVAI
jgi:hypothetical protein